MTLNMKLMKLNLEKFAFFVEGSYGWNSIQNFGKETQNGAFTNTFWHS
jgi:hypothetical protein